MKNTLHISVGISAYNEENNILSVLEDIFSQNQNEWKLKEVFVYSDGSTDKTVEKIKSYKNSLIKLNSDNERRGKTARLQEMFQHMKGDILVMFDADIKLDNENVITRIVDAFKRDEKVMLVGGNTIPYFPKNFFQRGVYGTFKVFYNSRLKINNGDNLFSSTGACMAIRRKFAKEIDFPNIKNQDTFLYFSCKSKGYSFSFVKEAIVYYKLPNTLSDYVAQIFRSNPEAVQLNLTQYFGDLVKKEYDRGAIFYAKNILEVFFQDPFPVSYIIVINILCRPLFRFKSKTNVATWDAVTSTK